MRMLSSINYNIAFPLSQQENGMFSVNLQLNLQGRRSLPHKRVLFHEKVGHSCRRYGGGVEGIRQTNKVGQSRLGSICGLGYNGEGCRFSDLGQIFSSSLACGKKRGVVGNGSAKKIGYAEKRE